MIRVLELAAMVASIVLLIYALYAAQELVPRKRPAQAIALNVLASVVGAVGWEAWIPGRLPWSCSALMIALAVMLTIWRREASMFVRCQLSDEPPGHPRRRASDLQQA